MRKFTPGTHCGAGGSLSAATTVSQTAYVRPGSNIVPQPNDAGSIHNLDSLGDRLMQKAQYRNVGGAESLWVVHTTIPLAGSSTRPQWAQLDVTGGAIAAAPVQQQIYAPDTTLFRWMGSIAADKDGNVAVGYSTSNGSSPNFPSIQYSGRLVGDPLNNLSQTETQLVAGNGSELNNCGGPCHRWGDYSSMSVDPSDSCTFWITNEYYVDQTGGNAGSWNTRIGSFSFTQPTQCSPAVSSPTVPAAPTGLSFTNVTAISMTLNWTDNATNEDGFVIYRSTDNVNFTFAAETAANAISGNISGLNPSTTYFWKVYAFTKGALSAPLSGTQATNAPGVANSTAAGGLWSQTTTWLSGIVPTSSDNVTVADGATVTIDTAAVALNVNVGTGGTAAVLQWEATTARTLTVGQGVTIASNGTFQSATSGTQTGHVLSVGTDLTNNGVLEFSTNGNTAGAGLTFTGAANNTFGGTGPTTDIRTLTINKGSTFASTLELNPSNFTVQGTTTDGTPMAFLTLTNGTLKVSGTFTLTGRLFTPAAYTIGASSGLWLNNPNVTVAGQNGSPSQNGLLRITQGTYNVGTSSGNSMTPGTGSSIIIEGGAMNVVGRLSATVGSGITGVNYTQSGGTLTVSTAGNGSSSNPSFGFESGSNFTMSGGTIIMQLRSTAATPLDYSMFGTFTVTGGTLQVGNGSTLASSSFVMRGGAPTTVVDNSTAGRTALINGANSLSIFGNLTLNSGTTLSQTSTGSVVMSGNSVQIGNVVNNGTISNASATGSNRFQFFGGFGAQTYSGTGAFGSGTTPYAGVGISNSGGVTLLSPMTVTRTNLFNGAVTGASNITLGNGGASTTVIQIGQSGGTTPGGSFDVSPTHSQGTGGEIILYLQETTGRTTSFEVNPTRILTSMTVDNTNNLTIAGGDLTLSSAGAAATLTNGRVITGANALALSSGTATVTRTNGYVDGNFRKNFSAAASKSFEVGTANGFSPVTVNATAGTFPADFTVKAVQGPQPNFASPQYALKRYWTLTATGITADLTFNYLDPTDIPVTANENVFVIFKFNGAFSTPGGSVNTAANSATITGVSSFSDWTLAQLNAPTAAPASISGKITTANGSPLAGVTIQLNGARSATTITNGNGSYRFDNVDTESFYTVTPSLANYHFAPANRSFSLRADKTDATFTAGADSTSSANAIDTNEYFVRQQYLDFLGREPDQGGFNYWTDRLNQCNADPDCLRQRRIDVSAAFFASQEFQETGSFVYRLYQGALGRQLSYGEFSADRSQIVGGPNLDVSKTTFANAFVARAEFIQKYQANISAESFVDALLQTLRDSAGVDLTSERGNLIGKYYSRGTMNESRALVLRDLGDNAAFSAAVYNPSFVLMEYFGYLQRGPDQGGYDFWLNVLNNRDINNYRSMVCAFITSTEYQRRFGTVVTRTNAECGR